MRAAADLGLQDVQAAAARLVNVVDLELTLEVRDRAHGQALLAALQAAGYAAEVVPRSPRLDRG